MRRFLLILAGGLGAVALLALALVYAAGLGSFGRADSEGDRPTVRPRTPDVVRAGDACVERAARELGIGAPRQILFGDLHVHSTISFDAFMFSLAEGARPVSDACDFARHCAALDFWSINDHASNIMPADWTSTIESVRACNALAGDPENPDVVAFLGWEWTQAGSTPDNHYGHKNVVLRTTDASSVPTRPIAASHGGTAATPPGALQRGLLAFAAGGRFHDLALRWTQISGLPACPEGRVHELPTGCREVAPTPVELFGKLDEWGHESIVIPHGTTWGIYTPPGSSWDKQLRGPFHDPERQTLIEVYSGHGDSEVNRGWRAVEWDTNGKPVCPPEREDFEPMCRRAGTIILERCRGAGEPEAECETRAEQARQLAASAGASPQVTVPGSTGTDWLDAGQCRDCGQPSFKYRPASSAQYIAALGSFDADPERPRRFRFGFMASSDIHSARAGSGYKEVAREEMTDGGSRPSGFLASAMLPPPEEPAARARPYEEAARTLRQFQLFEAERTSSFLYTGGLIAVHAAGRNRDAIWQALQRREVYGTSGPRLLVWFDLLGADGASRLPMGGEIVTSETPRFRVRAAGSFEQQPGCPADAREALGPDDVERLCRGECYHPSDVRRPIERIEIVRIRPQVAPNEPIADLIDDPWLTFPCEPDPSGCSVEFSDPDYPAAGRDSVYYARVFEPETPTINGDPLRCERDDAGRCVATRPCGFAGETGDQCLAAYQPRAWSSPIYVDYARDP